jgi:hypothetical protein
MQPRFYISCARDRPGTLYALFYYDFSPDVYGWHIEAKGHYFSAAFFMLENFYTSHATRLYRSRQDDVYGPWLIDYPPTQDEIRCPAPEFICHELESMQSRFVEEWLFFPDDKRIECELRAYREHALPVQEVNVRWKRLSRFEKNGSHWICTASGIDLNVIELLKKYWRLSEKIPEH